MSEKLPSLIDPLILAERRSMLAGAIHIAGFERLSDIVIDDGGAVQIELLFAKEGKQAVVTGKITAVLRIVCQSCLETMPWPLDIDFKLGVVASLPEAERLTIDCEPLLFNGEKLSLNALIEDEILLTLPDYPKHEYVCIKRSSSRTNDYDEQRNPVKTENPFAVLAKLKNTGE
ncbi:MAG: YceD family protein [Methylomonas sp.]|jgi:uncharacterized protein